MGHIIFIILHIAAIMFGWIGLVITIPAHVIYGAIRANGKRTAKAIEAAQNSNT